MKKLSLALLALALMFNAHTAQAASDVAADNVLDKASDFVATIGKSDTDKKVVLAQRKAERAKKRAVQQAEKAKKMAMKKAEEAKKGMMKKLG